MSTKPIHNACCSSQSTGMCVCYVGGGVSFFQSVLWLRQLHWNSSLENQIFAYTKTKAQIICAVNAQLISAFDFATLIKLLAPVFDCTGRLVSALAETPKTGFLAFIEFVFSFIYESLLCTCSSSGNIN